MPYLHTTIRLILALTFLSITLHAQPATLKQKGGEVTLDLSGHKWKMKRMLPGQGEKEGLHQLPPTDIETLVWNPAHVPGDVYTDLWKAGVIDDPYFGRNSAKAQWVMYNEWWYVTQFRWTGSLEDKFVQLDFDGVDYSCDVWLNKSYLGSHEGAFSSFSFDITKVIRTSGRSSLDAQNMLVVRLNPPPQVNAKVAGRKTPWFGDYWRDLVPFGIWRPINIVATGAVRVNDLYANPKINDDGSADIRLEVELENLSQNSRKITIDGEIAGANFESQSIPFQLNTEIKPGVKHIKKSIHIDQPKLWYPWDLGDQNLYNAKVSISENKNIHDQKEVTFGIREVIMEWNPGFTKDEVSFPRTVKINGKVHWIRSACWGGPPDIFTGRTSVSEYKKIIQLAKEMNLNNIRIFGWHPPEIPEFYQLCNEAGLTVWQDIIPLGTGNLPRDEAYLQGTIAEAIAVIKERRNHPCLILLEGGEEAFLRTTDPKFTNDFLLALGDSVQNYLNLPYVPDSPLTYATARSVGYKAKEADHVLAYFYAMGNWLMEDYLKGLDYPIYPEFAITSVPSVESLKKFIPENELWPPGLSWGHHWADLDRLKMQNFDTFDDERTGSLEEFVNASQDAQGIIFQLGVEQFRRAKPRVSGVALCHLITYWPDMKWGIIDAYQQPKRSFTHVQNAYQPLLVTLDYAKRRWQNDEPFTASIWVVNDLYDEYKKCNAVIKITDDNGKKLLSKTYPIEAIKANSSEKFVELNLNFLKKVEKTFHVELGLMDDNGKTISQNSYFFLIGDQQKASDKMKAMGKAMRARNGKYTYGNYYRFFPDVVRKGEKDWQSGKDAPKADGF